MARGARRAVGSDVVVCVVEEMERKMETGDDEEEEEGIRIRVTRRPQGNANTFCTVFKYS